MSLTIRSLIFFFSTAVRVRLYIKLMQKLRIAGRYKLATLLSLRLQSHGIFISARAEIADTAFFPHPFGIVIGEGVKVGSGATIYQHVTIGGARLGDALARKYPVVGEEVVIFAGAVVVGDISVGRGAVIGANSVVTASVPDGATAVGAPARVVKRKQG